MSTWWDEDHKLLLLTPEEFASLPDGEMLTCIDDSIAIKGTDEIDDDTRDGHLAYGVVGNHPLRVAHLERMANRPIAAPFSPPPHQAWTCKIGVLGGLDLPSGADGPMRKAAEDAFFALTGRHAEFAFTGWGGKLDLYEFAVVSERGEHAAHQESQHDYQA